MNTREIKMSLAAGDPVGQELLDRLDLEAMEAELLADLDGEQPASLPLAPGAPPRHRVRRFALATGVVALVVTAVAAILGGGASRHAPRAYGAELVRFAEATPLLLLEGSGWRVQDLNESRTREGTAGIMDFVTGRPVPDESIRITAGKAGFGEEGMLPAAVRQRKVQLSWRTGRLEPPPGARRPVSRPVLGTTATIDTHAGRVIVRDQAGTHVIEPGKPGDRQMAATWKEGDYVLELRAAVPDLAAFEERLGWLTRVSSQAWLDAMPAKVVKAADHEEVVREMLKGIPLPGAFKPSRIPNEGLTTDRSQVAGEVVSAVSCLWFGQWGEARRTGNRAAKLEAERAIASAPRWPVVRQLAREGRSSETLLKLVKSMPTGVWQFGPHRWRLLPKAEGLGCARLGIPLLPRKIKRQEEHGPPPPPN
ncbi:MAG TPA: hypothetical protein VG518_09810 [Solirubrobacterales bacterium]|nr:hypothetical protein [Solirubrobacterales bacterium]